MHKLKKPREDANIWDVDKMLNIIDYLTETTPPIGVFGSWKYGDTWILSGCSTSMDRKPLRNCLAPN